ncbi:TPA: SEL1-like repeat protein [Raoultella ornithinolytica]|nr:SEL1-like repeat protein [Raoultella ornithinolytica]
MPFTTDTLIKFNTACYHYLKDEQLAGTPFLKYSTYSKNFAQFYGFSDFRSMLESSDIPVNISAINAHLEDLRNRGFVISKTATQLTWPLNMEFSTVEITALVDDQLKRVEHFVPHTHRMRGTVPLMQPNGDSTWHIADEALSESNITATLEWFEALLGKEHVNLIKGRNEFIKILNQQSNIGNGAAKHALAVRMMHREQYLEAKVMLENAVDLGNIDAHVELARIHLYGMGVPMNYELARIHYETAAAKEHNIALNELAHMYSPRGELETNLQLCFHLHKRAVKAGNFDSIGNVGSMLDSGLGVERDRDAALTYFLMGERVSDGCSTNSLAYQKAMREGDFTSALPYLIRAAECGDIEGLRNLGIAYIHGWSGKVNLPKGLTLLIDAAKQNDAEAMYVLAQCFYEGHGIKKSYKTCVEFLQMASDLCHGAAQNKLAVCYIEGKGVDVDVSFANELLHKAIKNGFSDAYFNLSQSHRFGRGYPANDEVAFSYMLLAAEGGNRDAMEFLAQFYLEGIGTGIDPFESHKWSEKAEQALAYVPYYYVHPLTRPYVPATYFTEV